MTLARFFSKLRSEAGLSLRAVGLRAKPKMDATTLWKIESGRPVRAKTLGQALHAVGLTEAYPAYVKAFALWSTEQAKTLPMDRINLGIASVRRINNRALDAALKRACKALVAMPDTDWPIVLDAIEQPAALKLWMQARK